MTPHTHRPPSTTLTPSHQRSRRRTRTGTRTAAAALLAAALVASPSASGAWGAADPGNARLGASQEGSWLLGNVDDVLGPGRWHTAEEGRTWYGAYRTFDDEYAYCVDAGLKTPRPRHFDRDQPAEVLQSPQAAWALDQHAESSDDDVQAALSALVRLDEKIPHRHVIPAGHPADLGEEFAQAAHRFEAITADAEKFAGPYTLEIDIQHRTPRALESDQSTSDGGTGEEDDIARALAAEGEHPHPLLRDFGLDAVVSLKNAAGNLVPDQRVQVTVDGAEPADANIVTGEEPTHVDLLDVAADVITVEATAVDLPATTVELHRPRGLGTDRVQAVVTAGEPTRVSGSAVHDRGPVPTEPPEEVRPPLPSPSPSEEPKPLPSLSPLPFPMPTFTNPRPTVAPEQPEQVEPSVPAEEPQQSEQPPRSEAPAAPSLPRPTESPEQPSPPSPPAEPSASPTLDAPETPTATETPTAVAPPAIPDAATPEESASHPPAGNPPAGAEDDAPVLTSLPRTGVDTSMAIGLAIVLIAAGVAALTAVRRA